MARKADIDDRIELVGEPVKEVKRGIRLLKGDEELRDQLECWSYIHHLYLAICVRSLATLYYYLKNLLHLSAQMMF